MKPFRDELLKWICERDAGNYPLDRSLLREKACELIKKHELNGLKCTDRWLSSFLTRHGFSPSLRTNQGPVFANYRVWIDLVRAQITRYRHEDLYHLDELTMYTDADPKRVSIHENESALIGNRVTVLMCCNSTGTVKFPLSIRGSYPGKLKIEDHVYEYDPELSTDPILLKNYVCEMNARAVESNREVLLLLGRHRPDVFGSEPLSNVNFLFFPEHFPANLRPLRRDVFHYVKMTYRQRYTERLRDCPNEWTVHDALETLIHAWDEVPREVIIHSFQRTGFRIDDCFLQFRCNDWDDLSTGISFRRYVTFDDDLPDRVTRLRQRNRHKYNLRGRTEISIDEKSNDAQLMPGRNLKSSPMEIIKRILPEEQTSQPAEDGVSEETEVQSSQETRPRTGGSAETTRDKALTLPATTMMHHVMELADRVYGSGRQDVECPGNEVPRSSGRAENNAETVSVETTIPDSSSLNPGTQIEENEGGDKESSTQKNLKETVITDQASDNATERVKDDCAPSKRKADGDKLDEGTQGKKLKTDDWWKKYETTFVFCPPNSFNSSVHNYRTTKETNEKQFIKTSSLSPRE